MPGHLITDPDTTPAALNAAATRAGWLALSAAMTDAAPDIADRDDLIVTAAPGIGHGAPACFLPDHAAIEIDGTYLGEVDPATANPADHADRARYGPAWGLLVHECAHARHTGWDAPPGHGGTAAAEAATLLEEARIEAAQIRRRPDDRHWLRASARDIILADTHPTQTATPAAPAASAGPAGLAPPASAATPAGPASLAGAATPAGPVPGHGTSAAPDPAGAAAGPVAAGPVPAAPLTAWVAAQSAALLLGRRDAGILNPAETQPVAQAVEAALGADTLAGLGEIWRAAFEVDDDQAEAMLDLGRRWCDLLGIDPTDPAPTGHPGAGTGSDAGMGGMAGGVAVAEAVEAALNRVAAAVASESAPTDPAAQAVARAAAAAATEQQARTGAAAAARAVFGTGRAGAGRPPVGGTRAPTPPEQAAARTLARLLGTAAVRERAATRTTSAVPPGRLRMRGALAADAQRAAGATVTAEPFTRTTRRATPTPPLRVGIACDVSGSMAEFTGPVASAAWILATAADRTPVPAQTSTVIYGSTVRPVTHPGAAPAKVTTFPAIACAHDIGLAIDALDGALDLARHGTARLLVIVSDGYYGDADRAAGQARIDRLRAAGCAVLWLAPDDADPLGGVTVHPLADPATTAPAIGRAAITALRATH